MLAIAGPDREASEKSNLGFIEAAAVRSAGLEFFEAAALPFAGCQCLCLPDGPTKHQVLSWLSAALSNGPWSSSQILQQLHVHQALEIELRQRPFYLQLHSWCRPFQRERAWLDH